MFFSRYIYLLCFWLAGLCAEAQHIEGIVTGPNGRLSSAVIKNLRTHDKSISDDIGAFSIKAVSGDTLVTRMPYYKNDTTVYLEQVYLIIQLKQTAIGLKEVRIVDSLSSPLLAYEQNKKDYKDIFWKGDDSRIVSIPMIIGPVAGIKIDIDKIYSLVSKQGKDARRLQHILYRDYHDEVVDQRFNRSLVSRVTGFKDKKLDDFIIKNRPTYEFTVKATGYDMIRYIKKKMAEEKNS